MGRKDFNFLSPGGAGFLSFIPSPLGERVRVRGALIKGP